MPSSQIVTCTCGTSIRLPDNRAGRSFRCPKCKQPLAVVPESILAATVKLSPGQAGTLCQICQTATTTDEDCVVCPLCEQIHHRECWTEIGGCGTYGCKEAPQVEKTAMAQPLSAWGDTKRCPACDEEIKSIALKCRHCGTTFDTVDPMSAKDLRRQNVQATKTDKLKQSIVALFVASFVGCAAPLILILCLAILVPQRSDVKKCGPLHTTLAVIATLLSAFFTMLIVAFLVFEAAT